MYVCNTAHSEICCIRKKIPKAHTCVLQKKTALFANNYMSNFNIINSTSTEGKEGIPRTYHLPHANQQINVYTITKIVMVMPSVYLHVHLCTCIYV